MRTSPERARCIFKNHVFQPLHDCLLQSTAARLVSNVLTGVGRVSEWLLPSAYKMDDFFHDFRVAMQDYNGYALAATLTPEPPADNAGRLYSFHRGATKYTIRSVLAQEFLTNEHLSEEEVRAWVDLYESYYNAVGELLATEEAANSGRAMDAPWINVFEAWKEVVNQLIRGYKANCFPSWSIPCLYVVADYLSKFAILADEQVKGDESNMMFTSGYDDEIMGDADENYCLQEAARQINLIFSTAISDRSATRGYNKLTMLTNRNPLEDSRKWATYHIANILFSVHFRVRVSIPLVMN